MITDRKKHGRLKQWRLVAPSRQAMAWLCAASRHDWWSMKRLAPLRPLPVSVLMRLPCSLQTCPDSAMKIQCHAEPIRRLNRLKAAPRAKRERAVFNAMLWECGWMRPDGRAQNNAEGSMARPAQTSILAGAVVSFRTWIAIAPTMQRLESSAFGTYYLQTDFEGVALAEFWTSFGANPNYRSIASRQGPDLMGLGGLRWPQDVLRALRLR